MPSTFNKKEFFALIRKGNIEEAKKMLMFNPEFIIKKSEETGFTILMSVALKGYVDLVEWLIEMGANIYVQSTGGENCFHYIFSGLEEDLEGEMAQKYFEIINIFLTYERNMHLKYSLAISAKSAEEEIESEKFYLFKDENTGVWNVTWKENCGLEGYEIFTVPMTEIKELNDLADVFKSQEAFLLQPQNLELREKICQRLRLRSTLLTMGTERMCNFTPFKFIKNTQIRGRIDDLISDLPTTLPEVTISQQLLGLHTRSKASERKDSYGSGPSYSEVSSVTARFPSPSMIPIVNQSGMIKRIANGIAGFFGLTSGYKKLSSPPELKDDRDNISKKMS